MATVTGIAFVGGTVWLSAGCVYCKKVRVCWVGRYTDHQLLLRLYRRSVVGHIFHGQFHSVSRLSGSHGPSHVFSAVLPFLRYKRVITDCHAFHARLPGHCRCGQVRLDPDGLCGLVLGSGRV